MTKRIIAVRFLQSNGLSPKEYSYFTDDDSIKVGDHCVVDVVSNDYGSGLRIVQVTQTEGLSVGGQGTKPPSGSSRRSTWPGTRSGNESMSW